MKYVFQKDRSNSNDSESDDAQNEIHTSKHNLQVTDGRIKKSIHV